MRRRSSNLLAVLAAAALVVAACGGGDDDGDDTSPTTEADSSAGDGEPVGDGGDGDGGDGDGDAPADEPAEDGTSTTLAPLEDDDQLTSLGEGSQADPNATPEQGGEITWGLSNDGTGFATNGSIAPGSIRVITAMVDALVGLDGEANWHPNLAESLTPNGDFTEWTITMRPDLQFHDGEPVDAAAVAANLQAFKDSSIGFALAPVASIEPVSDLDVLVTMSSPWAAFPYTLVNQPGWMVSPETIGQNDSFVSTGPFMLESWTPGDGARVVRNPNYWRADEGLPYLDAINFKFLVEETVKRQAFEAGDIQGYISPGDEDIVDFLADDSVDVWISTAGANEYAWILNTTRPPFDDVRVRRAMAHGIDRQFLIDNFQSGLTVPASGPLNPSDKWYSETTYPEFDPGAAQALVDEYEAEVGPIEFELSIEPNPAVIERAEVMLSFLADVGIEGSIKEIGQGQSAITAIADDFQAFSWFQFGSPDPDGNYVFFHSSGGILNWSNLVSADVDAGLDAGRESPDEAGRKAGYAQFLQALADEVPIVWVDHLNGVEAAVAIPQLREVGQPSPYRDGTLSLGMTNGSFFAWQSVWLEQ